MGESVKRKGTLFVLSAPSGGGKSSVLRALLGSVGGLAYSVSATTRAPRGEERDGVDYYFVSDEEFGAMVDGAQLYEWAEVHGNRYGTRRDTVQALLDEGRDVVLDIDVQGARSVKEACGDAVTVFLLPPSMERLEERLRGRLTDDDETIRLRLRNAVDEIGRSHEFDFRVVNDDLARAVEEIRTIILSKRS